MCCLLSGYGRRKELCADAYQPDYGRHQKTRQREPETGEGVEG